MKFCPCWDDTEPVAFCDGRPFEEAMRRVNNLWTNAEMEHLKALVAAGVSANRAGVILRRTTISVQTKARVLGTPFTSKVVVRMKRREAMGTGRA